MACAAIAREVGAIQQLILMALSENEVVVQQACKTIGAKPNHSSSCIKLWGCACWVHVMSCSDSARQPLDCMHASKRHMQNKQNVSAVIWLAWQQCMPLVARLVLRPAPGAGLLGRHNSITSEEIIQSDVLAAMLSLICSVKHKSQLAGLQVIAGLALTSEAAAQRLLTPEVLQVPVQAPCS